MKTAAKAIIIYSILFLIAEFSVRVIFPEYKSLCHGVGII
jgi:hypothetical protein